MTALKEAALRYASRGFQVVPLWPRGKLPMQNLRNTEPSSDPRQIRQWWELCATANIGLPTDNHYNALVVLDLDVGQGVDGTKTLKKICMERGLVLPDTAVARSGSGGYHVYYRNPGKLPVPGGKDLFPGIDVRAEGAHIVAPPSIHADGGTYRWVIGDETKIAPLDENVLRLLEIFP